MDKIPRFKRADLCRNFCTSGADGRPVVGRQNQNGELSPGDLLLVFKILIRRNEDLEFPFRFPKEITVLQSTPAHLLRCANDVAGQELAQWKRRASVEEDFHAAGWSVSFWAYSSTATTCSRVTSGKQ